MRTIREHTGKHKVCQGLSTLLKSSSGQHYRYTGYSMHISGQDTVFHSTYQVMRRLTAHTSEVARYMSGHEPGDSMYDGGG